MVHLPARRLGADVIKIEKPGRGDSIRYADRTGRLPPEIGGLNFQGLNRNKRGITVDIGQDGGRRARASPGARRGRRWWRTSGPA